MTLAKLKVDLRKKYVSETSSGKLIGLLVQDPFIVIPYLVMTIEGKPFKY